MNWLRKLPGYQRTPYGFELRLLRLMPRVLVLGSLLPLLLSGLARLFYAEGSAAEIERRKTRERNQIVVPSYVYMDMPDHPELDGDQFMYVAGYEPEAARARGRVQALEMARQFDTAIIVVTHDEKIIPTFKRIYHIRDGVTHEEVGEGRGID